MFESPTITCSRRNRSASACGSSRVLMIGRDRVVALETPSQMCSARWLTRVDRAARRLQHLAGAADQLPGDQERDQYVGQLGEVAVPADQVVLVAAVAVAGRVGVVLEQVDVAEDALVVQPLLRVDQQTLEDPLTGLVVRDQVGDRIALPGRVLRVGAHVEVEPCPVAEEDVAAPPPGHDAPKQVPRHLVGGQSALTAKGTGDAVLVLQTEDSPVHITHTTAQLRQPGHVSGAPFRGVIPLMSTGPGSSPGLSPGSSTVLRAVRTAGRRVTFRRESASITVTRRWDVRTPTGVAGTLGAVLLAATLVPSAVAATRRETLRRVIPPPCAGRDHSGARGRRCRGAGLVPWGPARGGRRCGGCRGGPGRSRYGSGV